MTYYGTAYAKPENLVKVAATKDENGHVSVPPRMRRDSFSALVRQGWLKKLQVPAPAGHWSPTVTRYAITAEGEKALAKAVVAEANPFVGGHGAKAQETFKLLGTKHSDWFHPAVKWVRETRDMPFEVTKRCPTCRGEKYVLFVENEKGGYDVAPMPNAAHDYEAWRKYMSAARAQNRYMSWNGNCPTCKKHGRRGSTCTGEVFSHIEWRPVEMMVGYIVWPKGVKFDVSRFGHRGNSRTQCEICGKGINKSGRVPVAHDKNGKAFAMYVGEDCARKFTKVAKIAAPSKDENPKGLPSVLDVNYEVPEVK